MCNAISVEFDVTRMFLHQAHLASFAQTMFVEMPPTDIEKTLRRAAYLAGQDTVSQVIGFSTRLFPNNGNCEAAARTLRIAADGLSSSSGGDSVFDA